MTLIVVFDESHFMRKHVRSSRIFKRVFAIAALGVTTIAVPAFANGLYENRPWGFQTSADKANKAAVVDLIERKKGGYYDGFNTYVTNTTHIGQQVNCSNGASVSANIADSAQAGPNTQDNSAPSISADGTANSDATILDGTTQSADVDGQQSNQGDINSDVDSSSIAGSFGGVHNGGTDQDFNNDQNNSGTLTSSVNESTACDFAGTAVSGSVNVNAPLN
jgi:hypothetical protein